MNCATRDAEIKAKAIVERQAELRRVIDFFKDRPWLVEETVLSASLPAGKYSEPFSFVDWSHELESNGPDADIVLMSLGVS